MISYRFKRFLRERNEFSKTGEETLLSVSEFYGVKPRSLAFAHEEHESRAESLEGYRIVKAGDLVMNYMLAWKGAYGISDNDGIVSPAYAVFDVDERFVDRRFLHHRTRSDDMKALFRSGSKGIIESRLRLYPDSLLATFVDLPDLATQKQIADFLDAETARIDALIAKKQRLIEVVGEGLAACLEGLTSPTDKNADMIPFRWVCRVVEGQVDPTHPDWAGAPLIAPNHIQSGTGRLLEVETAEEQGAISGKYSYPAGTVLGSGPIDFVRSA